MTFLILNFCVFKVKLLSENATHVLILLTSIQEVPNGEAAIII